MQKDLDFRRRAICRGLIRCYVLILVYNLQAKTISLPTGIRTLKTDFYNLYVKLISIICVLFKYNDIYTRFPSLLK